MSFDLIELNAFLLVGAAVALVAIASGRLSAVTGFPSLLLYLLIGALLGEDGFGIAFEDAQLAHALGFAALVLILAEGGLTTDWREAKPTFRLGVSLATVGVAVSVTVVALGAHFLLGLSWQISLLLGAVLSPTDAAAVFSLLRALPLPRRLTATLENESGLNDAPTVVLVTLLSTGAVTQQPWWWIAGFVLYELVVGCLLGLAIAWLAVRVLRTGALPATGLYPLAVLCWCVLAYAVGSWIYASGFAATYVAALVLGNSELPHRVATRSFAEGLAWLAQIGLFVMLGLLLSPDRITMRTVFLAVAVGLILTLVARPLSVLVSCLAMPIPLREQAFLSWAGLRGAVPIVLTTIPLAAQVPHAYKLFDLVFVLAVIFTALTGPTLPWVARKLRLVRRSQPREVEIEAAPLERIAADLLEVSISPRSRLHGVEIAELGLPVGASVSLVIREETLLVPESNTILQRGDDLLIVVPRKHREATEQRLTELSRHGRLAGWLHPSPLRTPSRSPQARRRTS